MAKNSGETINFLIPEMSENGVGWLEILTDNIPFAIYRLLMCFIRKIDAASWRKRNFSEPDTIIEQWLNELEVDQFDNVVDSDDESTDEDNPFIEVPEVEPEETISHNHELPESSTQNAHLQELVEHNVLLRQRESSLMQMLQNTTDGSFRLIMSPGTVSIISCRLLEGIF